MKLLKNILVVFLALLVFSRIDAQNVYQFSLSDAIDYAMENNVTTGGFTGQTNTKITPVIY